MKDLNLQNLSDGESDGIMLAYIKNGEVHPVGFTKEQAEMLDVTIGLALMGTPLTIISEPIGKSLGIKSAKGEKAVNIPLK